MIVVAKSESIDETMVLTDVSLNVNPDLQFSQSIGRAATFVSVGPLSSLQFVVVEPQH